MKRNNARTHVFGIGTCMSTLLIAGCLAGCTPDNAGQPQQAGGEGVASSSTQAKQDTKAEQDTQSKQDAPNAQTVQTDQSIQASGDQTEQTTQAAKATALEHIDIHHTVTTYRYKNIFCNTNTVIGNNVRSLRSNGITGDAYFISINLTDDNSAVTARKKCTKQ